MDWFLHNRKMKELKNIISVTYLGPYQTFMMDIFYENNKWLEANITIIEKTEATVHRCS